MTITKGTELDQVYNFPHLGDFGSRLTFNGSKVRLIFSLQQQSETFWIRFSYFLNFEHYRKLLKVYIIR